MRGLGIALLGCLVFSATGGEAEDRFARPGPYVGVAGAIAAYPSADEEIGRGILGAPVRPVIENSVGVKLRAGYRAHRHLAAEIEGEYLPPARFLIGSFELATLQSWAVTANAKAFAFTGRFQPFALVGVGIGGASTADRSGLTAPWSATGFVARFGGGLDVHATDHLVVVFDVSYLLATGELQGADWVSFGWGLAYRF